MLFLLTPDITLTSLPLCLAALMAFAVWTDAGFPDNAEAFGFRLHQTKGYDSYSILSTVRLFIDICPSREHGAGYGCRKI